MKKNYQLELDNTIKELTEKNQTPTLLLHSCCAPCSSYVLEYLSNYFNITIYFYNPNIDEIEEFNKRSEEQIRLIEAMNHKNNVNYYIENYDKKEFEEIAINHENDIEGGERCHKCYYLRLRKTAEYAKDNNFDYFTTTLSISPYKNSFKLNELGMKLEEELNIKYLQADFKKKNGYKRSIELSREYGLYRQDYCGCIYSKRDHERRLAEKKEEKIIIPNENNKIEVTEVEHTLFKGLDKNIITSKLNEKADYSEKKINTNKPAIFLLLIILLLSTFIKPSISLANKVKEVIHAKSLLKVEEIKSNVTELFIYGRHMNIKGYLEISDLEFEKVYLFSDSGLTKDINYDYQDGIITYNLATEINDGLLLDSLEIGTHNLFLAIDSFDKTYYYALENNSGYNKTDYYTVTKENKNNKIEITNEKIYNTISLNVESTNDKAYDVIIDPGHGGRDSGACSNGVCETDYTLEMSNMLKTTLEKNGLKVYLTRDNEETLKTYGTSSRTGIGYEKKGKLLISLHLNAGPQLNGFEIYTPYNINYSFAEDLSNNIKNVGALEYSTSPFNFVRNGIYTRTMSDTDLANFVTDAKDNNYEKYTVDSNTNYYYIIRETGGYITGAYVDGREGNRNNPYVNSNIGLESYIIELGYITNENDRKSVNENKNEYIEAIKNSIIDYIK